MEERFCYECGATWTVGKDTPMEKACPKCGKTLKHANYKLKKPFDDLSPKMKLMRAHKIMDLFGQTANLVIFNLMKSYDAGELEMDEGQYRIQVWSDVDKDDKRLVKLEIRFRKLGEI